MRNYVISYCVKNQYEMIEEFTFKNSPVNFDEVKILIFDDNSVQEQKDKLKNLCNKYENIDWVNPDVDSDVPNPVVSSFKCVDDYLIKNKIDVDWILFFENDCFPFQKDFWKRFDETLNKHKFLKEKVGTIGFSSYQNFSNGLNRLEGSPTIGRGNLVNGILKSPHAGWYKDLPNDYYEVDYFVVEVPNWQSICINRKLFRDNIEVDLEHKHRLLSVDSVAHQFMSKNIFNIVFPKLAVYHDNGFLKSKINLTIDNSYSRSNNSENMFEKKWGWRWGYRNTSLRNQFKSNLQFWSDKKDMYENSIQKKLFEMHVSDGPKTIEDFYE